ncbi:hypothetical protein D9M71_452490 [compost metagenome]
MADRGNEIEFVDKGARRLLEDDQHALGGTGNLRRATCTRQTDFRRVVITHDGGVDVAETVDLRRAEETDVNAPALQPVTENLAGRHHGVGGFRQLTVANRQWQYTWLGTDRARFVDQHHIRRGSQARQVGRFRRQADADEAHRAVLQATGSGNGHHFIGGVSHYFASEAAASLAWNSLKSALPWMYSLIHAVKVSRSRAIGSQAW